MPSGQWRASLLEGVRKEVGGTPLSRWAGSAAGEFSLWSQGSPAGHAATCAGAGGKAWVGLRICSVSCGERCQRKWRSKWAQTGSGTNTTISQNTRTGEVRWELGQRLGGRKTMCCSCNHQSRQPEFVLPTALSTLAAGFQTGSRWTAPRVPAVPAPQRPCPEPGRGRASAVSPSAESLAGGGPPPSNPPSVGPWGRAT